MLVTDRHFLDQDVVIDGADYERCIFERCRLIYHGGSMVGMRDNTITDCQFALEGAAGWTMRFLTGLAESSDEFLLIFLRSLKLDPKRLDRILAG